MSLEVINSDFLLKTITSIAFLATRINGIRDETGVFLKRDSKHAPKSENRLSNDKRALLKF